MNAAIRQTRLPAVIAATLALAAVLPLAGCWEGPGVEGVRRAVEAQLPGPGFDQETHVRLGRMTMGFAHWVVDLALDDGDEDERRAQTIVNAVHRVEVGVFVPRRSPSDAELAGLAMPRSLDRMLRQGGWQVMAETRTQGERAWVLSRYDGGAIRGLYLVSLDPSELSVVRLEGRFDEAFARALSERPREAADRILDDAG
jgi:hypothetical protein